MEREREKKRFVYGVFEAFVHEDDIDQDEYLIYKLDVDSAYDDVRDLGEPIHTLKFNDYPLDMNVVSLGSKIYFFGGYEFNEDDGKLHYTNKAHMFDLSSPADGVIPIDSMASPKPSPLVFGPVNHHEFYVFSGSAIPPSFEMLDTRSNTWENIPIPASFSTLSFNARSVLWGTDILISNAFRPQVVAYSTKDKSWRRILGKHKLPFMSSRPLFSLKDTCHVILASDYHYDFPELYMSVVNHDKDLDPVGPFHRVNDVVGLKEITLKKPQFPKGWGVVNNFFTFKDDDINYICIVRCAYGGLFGNANEHGPEDAHYIIDICNFTYTLLEGTKVKEVKVGNSWKFKYCKKRDFIPKWFLAVSHDASKTPQIVVSR